MQIVESVAGAFRDALDQIKLIHRDVKPANILLTRSGQVKLADLGLAKVVDESALAMTSSGLPLGTPRYMSPEHYTDPSHLDHHDIFFAGRDTVRTAGGASTAFAAESFFTLAKQIQEDCTGSASGSCTCDGPRHRGTHAGEAARVSVSGLRRTHLNI